MLDELLLKRASHLPSGVSRPSGEYTSPTRAYRPLCNNIMPQGFSQEMR